MTGASQEKSAERVMLTLELADAEANLDAQKRRLGLTDDEVDEEFGLVEISPRRHLYTLLADTAAAARVRGEEGVQRISSNPVIAALEDSPDDHVPRPRLPTRTVSGEITIPEGEPIDPLEAYEALADQDSVIIGDVETCRRKIEKFQAVGFDRLMCLMQFGHLSHEQVLGSIQRVGDTLIPELALTTPRSNR